jgi:class 3 adenylate cyclase
MIVAGLRIRAARRKAMGDGFMATFQSTARALECAVAVQLGVARLHAGGEPLRVRIGVNAGEPIVEGDDLFGSAVNLASRLSATAGGGEVLVPDVVRQFPRAGFRLRTQYVVLKGYTDPVHVFALLWQD